MSLQDRFDAALALITEHNQAVGGAGKPGFVDPEQFISCIKVSGGTSEERLRSLSHEDILSCMPAHRLPDGQDKKPVALAKEIAKSFRKGDTISDLVLKRMESYENKSPVTAKKAEKLSPGGLVAAYDPDDPDNAVGKRLTEMSKGQPFLVFSSGRTVAVDVSLTLLNELRQGYPARASITVGEDIKPIYKVGEAPDNFADENPLYKNRPLRPDGTCDQTGRSWEGVPKRIRQLVRLALDLGEEQITKSGDASDILDRVMDQDAWKKLRQRYHRAAMRFDELEKLGNLPVLLIRLGGSPSQGKPFDQGKKVKFEQPHHFDPHGMQVAMGKMAGEFYKNYGGDHWGWNK